LYARVQARIAKLKVPANLCEQYKPWFCALTLEIFAYQKSGFTGEYGLDRQLYDSAKTDGKAIAWFESPKMHLGLFTGMDQAVSRQLLSAEVSDNSAGADDPAELFKAWRSNDGGKIETLVMQMKAQFPLIYQHLLADRNRSWAPRLKQFLDGADSEMIVVGAAHWFGPDGLLAQLKAEGYKVTPYVAANPDQITAMPYAPTLITAAMLAGTRAQSR
jgi:uncharacterized protein YbaP (TraB family)